MSPLSFRFAIVHIGDGSGAPNGGTNCNASGWESDVPFDPKGALASATAAAGSTIHVSKSLDGPWIPLSPNTLGGCNNPAPWVHPNGTIYWLVDVVLTRPWPAHLPTTSLDLRILMAILIRIHEHSLAVVFGFPSHDAHTQTHTHTHTHGR